MWNLHKSQKTKNNNTQYVWLFFGESVSRFYSTFPDKELLKLNELLDGKYAAKSTWNGTWINNNEFVYIDSEKNFVRFNVMKNETSTIVDASYIKDNNVVRAVLSPKGNYVLFISDVRGIFRHSSLAQYKIFNPSKPYVLFWAILTLA